MQPVFNRPMLSGKRKQLRGIGVQTGQAGDRQYDFKGSFTIERALAGEAANLLNARPGKTERKLCQGFDGACLKAAMAFIICLGRL
jgi:hypothetical protein